MLYPLIFHPIFKERVWGGREIERLYKKKLPSGVPIGESWEISDQPGDASVIANGPLAGKDLRWLMENHHVGLLGNAKPAGENRFPLLLKILDAREKLSLQVHPSTNTAAQFGGETNTEMWFVADAAPGAELYAGLNQGVTRPELERRIQDGSVAQCFHRISVGVDDAMFLPSGRVHAIGAGILVFEIRQNSDTTYRIFDWNRVGLNGKPRELHVAQSLASIDFNDFEPSLIGEKISGNDKIKTRPLVRDPLFNVESVEMKTGAGTNLKSHKLQIIATVRGQLEIQSGSASVTLSAGQFCLVPACLERTAVLAKSDTVLLRVEAN